MADSKAKRKRKHLKRNGKNDPSIKRGVRPAISTHERKLPTKREKVDKILKREKVGGDS